MWYLGLVAINVSVRQITVSESQYVHEKTITDDGKAVA